MVSTKKYSYIDVESGYKKHLQAHVWGKEGQFK